MKFFFLHENCITSLITLVGSLFHAVDPPVGVTTEEKIDNVEAQYRIYVYILVVKVNNPLSQVLYFEEGRSYYIDFHRKNQKKLVPHITCGVTGKK